jgi:hypothetical protein
MSIEHMAMVFAADGIEAKARLLLLAYANRCDDHGFCWPGEDRLVAETGMSVSTLRRAKRVLTDMGLVKSVRRPDTSSITRINVKLLASMRRPERSYDDNLIEKLGFAEDAPTDPEEGSDLRTSHIDLALRSGWSEGQVNMTSGRGHIDLETLSEPPENPPSPSIPRSGPSAVEQGGGGGDAPQQEEQTSPAAAFVDGLPYRGKLPGLKQRAHLVAAARAAFAAGWREDALRRQLTADTENAKSMAAVYRYRLDPENLPAPPALALLPEQRASQVRPCCPECQRPLARGSEAVLCRDCRTESAERT